MTPGSVFPTSLSARTSRLAFVSASLVAAAGFGWPLVVAAVPGSARAAVPWVALALVPAVAVALALLLDRQVHTATTIAMLGTLTAVGAAVRIAGTGVGGVEVVFVVLILAGRAYGARFGFLLGMLVIALSSMLWGGFGPWTPFQAFACGWVAAGAGLLPPVSRRLEPFLLIGYGIVASYLFGLVMNFWYWPFATGFGTGLSYDSAAPLAQNLASFGLYSLITSTLTWDTVRALTTTVGLALIGMPSLAALRRASIARTRRGMAHSRRRATGDVPESARVTRRSSEPPGDGTRMRLSTAPDAVAAPPRARRPSVPGGEARRP